MSIDAQLLETYPILQFFAYEHLPSKLQAISKPFCELACSVAKNAGNDIEDAETYWCLRKLLEAKDCAVRAALPRK